MNDYEKTMLGNFQHHSQMLYILYERFQNCDKLLHDFKVLLIGIEQKFLWSMFDFEYKEILAEHLWEKNIQALKDQVKAEEDFINSQKPLGEPSQKILSDNLEDMRES